MAPTETGRRWAERRVLAYAHQGGAHEAPSSTLYAIDQAVRGGASGIELDVHSSADGVLVVCHDGTVDRTTDGTGAIAQLSWDQLAGLDNAFWFVPGRDPVAGLEPGAYPMRGRAPSDRSFGVARLEEVLDLLDDAPGVVLNLDIKATAPAVAPYEQALAGVLHRRGYGDRVIVASFLDTATDVFRSCAPDIATSAGMQAVAAFWQAVQAGEPPESVPFQALQVPVRSGGLTVVDRAFVEAAHDIGVAVHAWTVNDAAEMASLLELGVDGIITDVPSTLVRVLEEAGTAYHA